MEDGGFDYLGLAVFLLVFSLVILYMAMGWRDIRRHFKRLSEAKRALENFKSSVRVEGDRLVLPEFCTVEIGTIVYEKSKRFQGSFNVVDSRVMSNGVLKLSDICGQPFYLYFNNAGNAIMIAPGFVIRDGVYKDIVGICLNQDVIPYRSLELMAEKLPYAAAFAKIELTKEGFRGEVRLSGARKETKGPLDLGSRSASLMVCYKVGGYSECVKIAEATDTNPNIRGEYSWVLSRNPTILFQNILLMRESAGDLYQELLNVIKISLREYAGTVLVKSTVFPAGVLIKKFMAGYRPEYVRVWLSLFSPFKFYVNKEEMI